MSDPAVSTFLFTDIEGSTRLWEQDPDRMHEALARHDALARTAVVGHRGEFIKTTGDGIYAVFGDPLDALRAAVALQLALADPAATNGVPLHVRSGMHAGVDARRDNDFFGTAVNRAARVMAAAHGDQILVSQTVESLIRERLPPDLQLRDLGAVRLRGLAQSERVYQVVHPRLRQDFPALRMLESTPHNLPQPLTSFVGREHELAEGKRQLQSTRLLTLLGIGGMGKSRLSLAIAADVLDEYPDGVWFVELAPVTDARLVPQVVASILGVKEDAGRPVRAALVQFVRDRRLLLMFDNCEHLAQACAEIARDLLEAGPGVRIMASSRERLNIRGEKVYALAPLAVAPPNQHIAAEAVTRFPAVRLFADRAAAANADFAITDANSAAVVEICDRLDGIPLAIELAAARVRAMSVHAIASRLDDRFRLLCDGDRTALPRQQTLRATIDWSYDLLASAEQVLFRRLAVFAGGFTLEAAEQVAAGSELDAADVVDCLTQLIEKSLVTVDTEADRYGMLETVREYAQQHLESAVEGTATRTRHLNYFSKFVERIRPSLVGPEQGRILAQLDLVRENLIAAHRFCDQAENGAEIGLKLIRSLQIYWFNRGLLGLALHMTQDALARPAAQVRNLVRCRGLGGAGQLALFMGAHADAQQYLEESLAIAREIEDRSRVAAVLQPLGMAALGQGDFATAHARLDEALTLAETMRNEREIAAALSAMAQLRRVEGALDDAESLNLRALEICRKLGDRESIATGQLNLAMVAIGRRGATLARDMLLQGMTIAQEIGSKMAGQSAIEVAAGLAAMLGHWPQAARFFGAAEAQAAQTGIRRDAADEAFLAPLMALGREALGAEGFAEAERAGKLLPFESAIADARAWVESAA